MTEEKKIMRDNLDNEEKEHLKECNKKKKKKKKKGWQRE